MFLHLPYKSHGCETDPLQQETPFVDVPVPLPCSLLKIGCVTSSNHPAVFSLRPYHHPGDLERTLDGRQVKSFYTIIQASCTKRKCLVCPMLCDDGWLVRSTSSTYILYTHNIKQSLGRICKSRS